jgi:hypothetical protein
MQPTTPGQTAPPMELYAGWNPTAAAQDFNVTYHGDANALRAARGLPAQNGGLGGFSQPNAPTVNLQQVYDNALNSGNVTGLQAQADAVQKQIDDRRVALTDATGKINDNPFYSEATRVGRVAKLNDVANSDINNFTNQLGIATGKVSAAKADAQVKLGIAQNQYNIDDANYKSNVNQVNQLLTSGMLNNSSPQDVASIATTLGMPLSAVQSIIDTSKSKDSKPQLTTIDDGTNQMIVAIDPNTGEVISKHVLGASTAKLKGSSTAQTAKQGQSSMIGDIYSTFTQLAGGQGYVSKEDWAKMKQAALNTGDDTALTSAQFDQQFKTFKNPDAKNYGYVYQ